MTVVNNLGMLKLFEELGSMQMVDVISIIEYMIKHYQNQIEINQMDMLEFMKKHDKALALHKTLSSIPQMYVNSLPIQCKMYPDNPKIDLITLTTILEDYYEIMDEQLRKIKRHMYETRYVMQYVNEVK